MRLILEHKFYLSTVFTTNLCPTDAAKLLTVPMIAEVKGQVHYPGSFPGRFVRRREYRNEYYA